MRKRNLSANRVIPRPFLSAPALAGARPRATTWPVILGLALAVPIALAACSSGSSSSSTSTSAPPTGSSSSSAQSSPAASSASSASASSSTGAEPTAGPRAIASIEANWTAFFSASTPTSRRIALLQNGQTFGSVIQAQAGNPLSQAASAKVKSVTLSGASHATVIYDIVVGGAAGLSNQKGVAVYQGGIWKVGDASFCGLLQLENGGTSSGLPAACQG